MKAAAFNYVRANDLAHALALLAQHGSDARLVAGGQSLVPMMAMRLVQPAVLVDINRLSELKQLTVEVIGQQEGKVLMGAATRQRDVQDNTALHSSLPLLQAGLKWVGHVQTRNRGTVGGSLAHADPSAEQALAAVVLGAQLHLHSNTATPRVLAAANFFQGPMATALAETEVLVNIEWPVWATAPGQRISTAFDEVATRQGDFAMASATCQLLMDDAGICRRAAIGLGNMAGTPLAFPAQAAQLVGQRITPTLAQDVATACVALCSPGSDLHASSAYRSALGATLMKRVLLAAGTSAGAGQANH